MIYTLGVDIGTSGTKTILVNTKGEVLQSETVTYPMQQPQNGYAEQEPIDWYNAVIETVRTVVEKSSVNPDDIKGIGLSGQMHGLVMLDENDEVIRPAILWCDGRTGEQCGEITALVGKEKLMEITANPAIASFTAAKIMWIKKHEPQNYEKCRKIMLPKDYVRYMLTGVFATDVSDASGMQLLDIKNRCWSEEVLSKLEIKKELLPKVYESPDITGRLNADSAAKTGLTVETILVGGASDNAAAAVGTGVVEDNKAFTTIGTSGVLYAHISQMKIDMKGRVHTFCSAVPGEWLVMGVTQGAGLSIKWFRDTLCDTEMAMAVQQHVESYYLMDYMANKIEIGANKLIYLPYLMGERTPHLDTNARAVFFGLSAMHTKAHMIRAVLEGVCYSLNDCRQVLNELNVSCDDMMMCGGGAKSKLWKQMLSDIYGVDIYTPKSNEGAALGVAILALVGVGAYETVQQACQAIVQKDKHTVFNAENSVKYQAFYKLFSKLYANLKDSYSELAEL